MKQRTSCVPSTQRQNYSALFILSLPVASAYFPLSLALGLYAISVGLPAYAAPVAALFVYAGSAEFLAVGFMQQGVSLLAVAWLTFLVNFRHVFYGLSFPVGELPSRLHKLYSIFALTDEIYGVLVSKQGKQLSAYSVFILQVFTHFWWVSGALVGVTIGAQFAHALHGFEFALVAMFLVLAIDAVRHAPDKSLLFHALLAAALGLWFERALLDGSFLFVGIVSYCSMLLCRYALTSHASSEQ